MIWCTGLFICLFIPRNRVVAGNRNSSKIVRLHQLLVASFGGTHRHQTSWANKGESNVEQNTVRNMHGGNSKDIRMVNNNAFVRTRFNQYTCPISADEFCVVKISLHAETLRCASQLSQRIAKSNGYRIGIHNKHDRGSVHVIFSHVVCRYANIGNRV